MSVTSVIELSKTLKPDEKILFNETHFPELWLAFIHNDRLNTMLAYVDTDSMRNLILTCNRGLVSRYYCFYNKAIEHARTTQDPSILYLVFFHCIAYMEPVTKWAVMKERKYTPEELKNMLPRLPVGCEENCIHAFRNICHDYAQQNINMNTFNFYVFSVINVGLKDIGSVGWAEPPLPYAKLVGEALLKKKLDADEDDISDLLLTAVKMNKRRRQKRKSGVKQVGKKPKPIKGPTHRQNKKKLSLSAIPYDARADAIPLGGNSIRNTPSRQTMGTPARQPFPSNSKSLPPPSPKMMIMTTTTTK